jgi:hypothetical protein
MKELANHSPDKGSSEDKPRLAIQDPGDAIVRIATSRGAPKRRGLLAPCIPFLEILPLQSCVISVTSIGDVRHGRLTELQATMHTIEAQR